MHVLAVEIRRQPRLGNFVQYSDIIEYRYPRAKPAIETRQQFRMRTIVQSTSVVKPEHP